MTIGAAEAVALLLQEYVRTTSIHPPMNSAHEGYAVIKEELDELWEEIRFKEGDRDMAAMTAEAVQVGAMAVRFLIDVCGKPEIPFPEKGDQLDAFCFDCCSCGHRFYVSQGEPSPDYCPYCGKNELISVIAKTFEEVPKGG